jgi:hypothetical protein
VAKWIARSTVDKVGRLCAMSPQEIAYRLRDRARTRLERMGVNAKPDVSHVEGFKRYVGDVCAARFYRGHADAGVFRTEFPQWASRCIEEAERLCRHEISLLNLPPISLGPDIDWHRDPSSGQVWERRFWADYTLEDDPAGRDPKVIHELNRQQHLPRLAIAYRLTGDERYAAEAIGQVLGWIDQNPPGIGVNWHSSLEIGIRAISWFWTLVLVHSSAAFNEAVAQRIGNSLFRQLQHIYNHLSVFTSPNTHVLGEAAALLLGGVLFQDIHPAPAWRDAGAALLIREAEKQILPDGFHGELSSYYHCYALDFYLQALAIARINRITFPSVVENRVQSMLEVLMHLTRPDGTLPLLGDDDGGRALALRQKTYRSFADALCLGSILFRRGDFKYCSGGFAEETFWLLGEAGWHAFRGVQRESPRETHLLCPRAGYFIERSGWGPHDSHLVFDCGGLGMLTGGHSHADALSVVLFSNGREILTDPGTYVYNGALSWRDYFRSTRAHNTATVDENDQAKTSGTFRWAKRFNSRNGRLRGRNMDYVEGEHDGYGPLGGIVHRRRLIHIPGEYWIILDDFTGQGRHIFEFNFHFGAAVRVSSFQDGDSGLVVRGSESDPLLGIYGSAPMNAGFACGALAPISGWTSQGYGKKAPSLSLRARCEGDAPVSAVSVLIPRAESALLHRLQTEAGSASACSLRHGMFEDIVVSSTGKSEVSVAGLRMRGDFFWIRRQRRDIISIKTIGAAGIYSGNANLLEEAPCVQSAAS